MKIWVLINIIFLMALSFNAQASYKFTDLVRSLTVDKEDVVSEVPDISLFHQAKSIEEASAISAAQTYKAMAEHEMRPTVISESIIKALVAKKQLTVVIVPGLLGEFIDTRAFEEVFQRNSTYKNKWASLMKLNKVSDLRFNLEKNQNEDINLAQLIDAASIDDENGNPVVKLIILKTKLGSMESIGADVEKAVLFNRRLQKYYELTHDENMVMLGYSRGTPLALEMITQAEKLQLSYLTKVQAVVSYAGVVLGSSLADLTDDLATDSGRLFASAKKLQSKLQTSQNIFDRGLRYANNSTAVAEFLAALALNSKFDEKSFQKTVMSGDFKTVAVLIANVATELGFTSVIDFNGHVNRVKTFIAEILKAVDGLKTKNAVAWWKNHTLPKNIKYLSISAAMVDPSQSSIENYIYNEKTGYNDTLDDDSLQENRRAYEKATGFALNDSQVALHQSQFLPKLIENLNPNNSGLKIESLGLLQTHHWGVSLRVVNAMKDGRVNPFPREKVLLGLAAYLNQ